VSLSSFFSGARHASRHSRSGLLSTSGHGKKLRERDEGGGSAIGEEAIGPLGLLFCALLIAASTLILDYGVLPPAYKLDVRPPHNVAARLDFVYHDADALRRARDSAAERAARVYLEDPKWLDERMADLNVLADIVDKCQRVEEVRDRTANLPADTMLAEQLFKYNASYGSRREFLANMLLPRIRLSLQSVAESGILSDDDLAYERNKPGEVRDIRVLPGSGANAGKLDSARVVPIRNAKSISVALERLQLATWTEGLSKDLSNLIFTHLQRNFKASLKRDNALTNVLRERAKESVGSGEVPVAKDALILSTDQSVTRSDLEKLSAEWKAYKASLPLEARVKRLLGLAMLPLALLIMFILVAYRADPDVLRRRQALLMLGLFILAALAGTKFILLAGYSAALAPMVFMAMVASLVFGQHVAQMTVFGLGLLCMFAGIRWEAFPKEGVLAALPLALMAGGIVSALPAHSLQDRRDLLKYGVLGGLTQFILAGGFWQLGEGWNGVPGRNDVLLALISGPAYGLLALGSLPLIESIFGVLTNIRLFELADMDQPALRKIQLEAPGTFTHTLQVRALAEPAAEAIGANRHLVSAGVLYHDLGKTLKPEYFVENQMGAEELHRRLRPSVSALLITAHVKDGIELAREYGLPQQIIDFIPEHHGTTLVSYFYHSAKKDAEAQGGNGGGAGGEVVQESFFRYPGPKPQSRETALVMLADTLEAASRTLNSPSAARLGAFVHELIMEKMLDGQLDECDLTFADLALVEESFMRVLVTRFHSRIRYPGQAEEPAETPAATTLMETPPAKLPASASGLLPRQ
jgi:putative nucleotidyltransferase with HDIG domain